MEGIKKEIKKIKYFKVKKNNKVLVVYKSGEIKLLEGKITKKKLKEKLLC